MGNNKKRNHKQAQIKHSKKRFKQYYHKEFTQGMRRVFKRMIKEGLVSLVKEELRDETKSIYDLSYEGETYRVVYDVYSKTIVTFLPQTPLTKLYFLNPSI